MPFVQEESNIMKALKYSGIGALLLGAAGFILMMVTNAIVNAGDYASHLFPGTTVIFGGKATLSGGGAAISVLTYNPSPLALIGWILALVALVVVLLGVILPLLNINILEKFAGALNLAAVVLFVLAGVFMFIVIPTFSAANNNLNLDGYGIGSGWIIGAILFIAAGVVAILPAIMDFAGKGGKKKKKR